jgi:stage II sporulation protein D
MKSASLNKYQREPTISVNIDETGEIVWLKMEDYIQGVIAGEMDPQFPPEALAAQAIMARTMTIWSMETDGPPRQFHHTDACTSQNHLQVYNPKGIDDKIRQAVQSTRGLIATYRGDPVNAFFSSYSGGQTSTLEEGFPHSVDIGKTPYLASVSSPTPNAIPANIRQWRAEVPLYVVQQAAGWEAGQFTSVGIAERGQSGRVTKWQLGKVQLDGVELRSRLGFGVLKSTLVDNVWTEGDKVVFQGRGWGSGIGMDQWGAYALAEQGKKADEIARYYFQGIDLIKLWP